MNDRPSEQDPNAGDNSGADAEMAAAPHEALAETELPQKKSRVPLGEPVFGKLCWFICVVPYVIYLGGMGFAAYVEGGRAHVCIDHQVERVVGQFKGLAVQRFMEESGESEEAARQAYATTQLAELGLARFDKEIGVWGEFEVTEVREMISPLVNGPPANETRPWLIKLFEEVQEPAEFLDRLLGYDEDHQRRPILLDYYERYPEEDKTPAGVDPTTMWFPRDRSWYPTTYTIVISLTALSVLCVFPLYFRHPFKLTIWSVIVGVAGIFVWIGLWMLDNQLGLSQTLGEWLPFLAGGGREAFNPLEEMSETPQWRSLFLAIRLAGLVVIVPFIEEFFLRGWLMRYIEHPDWDRVPIGFATKLSIIGVAVYAVFSHTFEPLSAIVWFSMVTWLYMKTKSVWDCVLAHAITNLLLGIYVLMTHTWELW